MTTSSFKFSFEGSRDDFRSLVAVLAGSDWVTPETVPTAPAPSKPAAFAPVEPPPVLEDTPDYLKESATNGLTPEEVIARLPKVSAERRQRAFAVWEATVLEWLENFKAEGPQPDRLALIDRLVPHAMPVLVMAYEARSLQRLVEMVLLSKGIQKSVDEINEIAANMVQVAHIALPDLAGTYNYLPWR